MMKRLKVAIMCLLISSCMFAYAGADDYSDGNKGYITKQPEGTDTPDENCLAVTRNPERETPWYDIYVDKSGEMFIESDKGSKISLTELVQLMQLLKEQVFLKEE